MRKTDRKTKRGRKKTQREKINEKKRQRNKKNRRKERISQTSIYINIERHKESQRLISEASEA